MAAFLLADADAFGVIAIGPEWRSPGGADPLVAPLMAALLVLQTFAQSLHQLVKTAKRLDFGLFRVGQVFFGHSGQPVGGDIDGLEHLFEPDLVQPFETGGKGAVELVQVAFVLHHRHPGEVVERLDIIGGEALLHALQKGQILPQGYGDAGLSQVIEEGQKHRVR